MTQLSLPGTNQAHEIQAVAERSEPAVWVRRIQILRELDKGSEQVVRDIPLRRGLNIIWAPPETGQNTNQLFDSGLSGHTAGKTTLCRFIRYLLGERSFAAETTRHRIRSKLPKGWLIAEVFLNGKLWTVARPLEVGPHPFAVESCNIADTLARSDRGGYQTFLDALANATTGQLSVARYPTTDEQIHWDHLLPWLARDQECRFNDFLSWRHSSSSSDVPMLSEEDRQFLVRSVLGVITANEREEHRQNVLFVEQRKEAEQKGPALKHQAAIDQTRIRRLLDLPLEGERSDLFTVGAREALTRQQTDLSRVEEELVKEDATDKHEAEIRRTIEAETNAQRDLQEVMGKLEMERATIEQMSRPAEADKHRADFPDLPPSRNYCNVPMTLARAENCPLATSRPADLTEKRAEIAAGKELENARRIVRSLEEIAGEKRRALEEAEAVSRKARSDYMKFKSDFEKRRSELLARKAELSQAAILLQNAEEATQQVEQQAEMVRQITAQITLSYAKQEKLRQAAGVGLKTFSATFEYVIRAMVGSEVEAWVDSVGRKLALIVDHRGERESAAISTIKLVAFDLAAITSSIQGKGSFPRFLIHDGPREADMARGIYERIFLYAKHLEACTQPEPAFQYIVTTTTEPPAEFQEEPWLRLKLSGSPATERLLKEDL